MADIMRPYIPAELPLTNLDYRLLLPLVGQANAALARYPDSALSISKARAVAADVLPLGISSVPTFS